MAAVSVEVTNEFEKPGSSTSQSQQLEDEYAAMRCRLDEERLAVYREDLAEWISLCLSIPVSPKNFLDELGTSSCMCMCTDKKDIL